MPESREYEIEELDIIGDGWIDDEPIHLTERVNRAPLARSRALLLVGLGLAAGALVALLTRKERRHGHRRRAR